MLAELSDEVRVKTERPFKGSAVMTGLQARMLDETDKAIARTARCNATLQFNHKRCTENPAGCEAEPMSHIYPRLAATPQTRVVARRALTEEACTQLESGGQVALWAPQWWCALVCCGARPLRGSAWGRSRPTCGASESDECHPRHCGTSTWPVAMSGSSAEPERHGKAEAVVPQSARALARNASNCVRGARGALHTHGVGLRQPSAERQAPPGGCAVSRERLTPKHGTKTQRWLRLLARRLRCTMARWIAWALQGKANASAALDAWRARLCLSRRLER